MEYGIAPMPENMPDAMAYVMFQPNASKIYSASQGIEAGTMFPSLDKPFYGSKCKGDKK